MAVVGRRSWLIVSKALANGTTESIPAEKDQPGNHELPPVERTSPGKATDLTGAFSFARRVKQKSDTVLTGKPRLYQIAGKMI